MKVRLGCIPCILKQAHNVACLSTDNPDIRRRILDRVMAALQTSSLERSPAEESDVAYRLAAELSGNADPYRNEKHRFNEQVMAMYDELARLAAEADEPLHAVVKLAIAGNMIDLGIEHPFDVEADLRSALGLSLAIDDYARFAREAAQARRLLYVADNAGEIVLDKLLIETMGVDEVTVAVREIAIINDATVTDARQVGLDRIAKVITTGHRGIGAPPACWGDAFRDAWDRADVVVSKGQGNFETLDEVEGNVFYLLKAKCEYVADELGVACNGIVLAHRSRLAAGG